jgi:glycine/D-amino acid oxidase-like deaminating enzyme/nitrite reductase/ring-hydroxylating ferredoxin subunit
MQGGTGEETRSIWMSTPLPRFAPLAGDRQVDVAVIGAGITGITTAWLLKRRGRRVAVIEAAEVGSGETSRTSAHLTAVLDGRLSRLASRFGRDNAVVAVRAHQAAIDWIDTTARALGIDCDFQRVPGFLYCDDEACRPDGEDGRSLLDAEADAAQMLGLQVRRVPSAPLPFATGPALRFEQQAQFHPRRYLRGLVDALASDGCEVFERTRVLSVEDGEPCRVETERGTVTANAVVVASHVPVVNKVFLHTKLEPMRSYLMAVSTGQPHPEGLFWDLASPYHYWRNVHLDGQDLMLVGGGDHKVGEIEDTEGAFRELEAYVRQRLGRANVSARWSGQIIEPVDGLAYVGRNSMSTHVFVATGYSGNGLTGATAAAMILCDEVDGSAHPWSDLFAATRVKPVAGARAFMRQNASAARHLVTDRFRTLTPDLVASLPAGGGQVVEYKGEKLAVYREPSGALRALSAVCTHLGCQVTWNNAEQSWDCPCHGSRYAPDGAVVNGPAVRPLERRDLATLLTDEHARADQERTDEREAGGELATDPSAVPAG